MTFEDYMMMEVHSANCINQNHSGDGGAGAALREILRTAKQERLLTCGVYDSAQLLDRNAKEVQMCLLTDNLSGDVTIHLYHTIIEAFCWENFIPLIKVSGVSKLTALLENYNSSTTKPKDFNCILIRHSDSNTTTTHKATATADSLSVAMETLLALLYSAEDATSKIPFVSLPD